MTHPRHAIPADARYHIVIPNTRLVIDTVDALSRAKAIASFYMRRLAHEKYPPTVIVERVGPDGKRRKVWPVRDAERGLPTGADDLAIPVPAA